MAYADFLTALMAFFLLMWLISGVSPQTRADIAGYFTDRPVQAVTSGTVRQEDAFNSLLASLRDDDTLAHASGNVRVTENQDGIRIDLVDTAENPLFELGSGTLTASGHALAKAAGQVLAPMAYDLTLEGHTDAFPSTDPNHSNWDLSSERANDARRTLVGAGVSADRLRGVMGLAATQPLNPGQPHLSANRRVSILIHIDS